MTAGPLRSSLKSTTSAEGSSSQRDDVKKEVVFENVEIISFPLKMGDNPGTSEGAPLTIGWKPVGRSVENLEVYEFSRKGRRKRGKKLVIPAVEREVLLLSKGYNMQDILEASEAGEKARKERLKSLQGSKWDKYRFKGVLESFAKINKTKLFKSGKSSSSGKANPANDLLMVSSRTA